MTRVRDTRVYEPASSRLNRFQYTVDTARAGQRLDRALASLHPELSRSAAGVLIAQGRVRVGNNPAKAATRVLQGAHITLELPPPAPARELGEQIPLRVVYEDETLVVIDKPAGMVVHPAPGNENGTLVNALLGRYADLPGDASRPGIVHRLDKDTSGLIVVARTQPALSALAGAFKHRQVHKEYLALVVGAMRPANGAISGDIGRDPRARQRMAVLAHGGRTARTMYRTEESFRGFSLLRLVLETGRTHQIRVHCGAMGHPIVGDSVYGRAVRGLGLKRQFLHATRLCFRHPVTGAELDLEASLPDDLRQVLETVRQTLAS